MRFPKDFMPRLITNRSWKDKIDIVVDSRIDPMRWRMLEGFDFISLVPVDLPKLGRVQVRGMNVLEPPVASASQGSRAVYLAAFESKDVTLLLQFLPGWSSTSRHYHPWPVKEAYHVLAGRGFLEVSKSGKSYKWRLEKGHTAVVNDDEVHRYFTEGLPALTLLEITGLSVEDCLFSKRNHIYVPQAAV